MMNREYSKRLMPGVHYGHNLNGWLVLIRLGRYGLNLGSGFTGRISLRSWEWARYDYADHFTSIFWRWMAYPGAIS
jgi:hypothetical protein